MRLYVRSADRRPDPPPLPTDDRLVIVVGIAVWAVVLVALLVAHGWLDRTGRGWWVWTPVAGMALGLYGLRVVSRRSRPAAPPAPPAGR